MKTSKLNLSKKTVSSFSKTTTNKFFNTDTTSIGGGTTSLDIFGF